MKKILVSIMLTAFVSGCGAFRTTTNTTIDSESNARTTNVQTFNEFDSFTAEIPVAFIKAIELPSGARVILRDSLPEITPTIDDSTSGGSEPVLNFSSQRETVYRDSTTTETGVSKTVEKKKEVEVKTGNWLIWLVLGIAIAFALVIAGYLLLKRRI